MGTNDQLSLNHWDVWWRVWGRGGVCGFVSGMWLRMSLSWHVWVAVSAYPDVHLYPLWWKCTILEWFVWSYLHQGGWKDFGKIIPQRLENPLRFLGNGFLCDGNKKTRIENESKKIPLKLWWVCSGWAALREVFCRCSFSMRFVVFWV